MRCPFPPLSLGRLNENHMRKYSLVHGAKCELQRGKSDWFPVTNNNICVKPGVFSSVRCSSFSGNRSQSCLDSRRFGDFCYYLCASAAEISANATRCGKDKLCFGYQLVWLKEEHSLWVLMSVTPVSPKYFSFSHHYLSWQASSVQICLRQKFHVLKIRLFFGSLLTICLVTLIHNFKKLPHTFMYIFPRVKLLVARGFLKSYVAGAYLIFLNVVKDW